jgi:microsomal dipeptidase-like Zn-dependent dipeptidase
MRRRILIGLGAVLLLAGIGFFGLAPVLVERGGNKVTDPAFQPDDRALALHRKLVVVDLHADALLWRRDLLALHDYGHVDLPRLIAGNVTLQVFSSVTKTPRGQNYNSNSGDTDNITPLVIAELQPMRTWHSLLQRSLYHAEKLHDFAAASNGRLRIITSPADLDALLAARAKGATLAGGLLSTEGAQNLEGDVRNVDRLYAAGFRMLGLVHFFDNEVGGSMHGVKKGGLTALGVQVVQAAEQRGMVVDLAHSSAATFADVLRMARRPVVVSHGGVKAVCDTPRNLSDDQLRALAANGGLIGIGYWDAAVCQPRPEFVARAILHAVQVMGVDHVALGSDFDGVTTTGWDTADVAVVTGALQKAGMAEADIAKVMGGNAVRVLKAGLVPLA